MSSNVKYIGLDVHKEAISIAVLNGAGKLVMESIIETKVVTLLQFLQGTWCLRRAQTHLPPAVEDVPEGIATTRSANMGIRRAAAAFSALRPGFGVRG